MEALDVMDRAFWTGGASCVYAPPHLAAEAEELRGRLPEEGGLVFASSGTGGIPKWVSFRREALVASAEAVNAHLDVTAADSWMLALPIYHVGGFGVAARAYVGGCKWIRFEGRWDAMRFAEELQEHGVTLTSLVPTQVHDLVECGLRAPSSLRAVVVGGARLDRVVGQQARDLGWPVLQSYGMTEACSQIATGNLESLTGEFCDSPLPVLPIWDCRIGEGGCLQVRGDALFDAYLRVRESEIVVDRPMDGEGWFTTADVVEQGEGGLSVVGRADRLVKILGELVNVDALEELLQGYLPRGGRVHVLVVEDDRRGGLLVPMIEGGGQGVADVVRIVNDGLPGFSRLEAPCLLDALPRTSLGKVQVGRLRQEYERLRSS